jgi:hypothetical protein
MHMPRPNRAKASRQQLPLKQSVLARFGVELVANDHLQARDVKRPQELNWANDMN